MGNSSRDKKHDSIFEIMDGMMFQLSKTKKMFMIMILTTLIIPPIALVAMTSALDSPFTDKFDQRLEQRINERCRQSDIPQRDCAILKDRLLNTNSDRVLLQPAQLLIFAISLIWLGIGIKQWLSLSKWDKKYQKFRERQESVDKKLDEYFED
ncbi:MAG: hypothetical protein OEL77_01555 [Nitrosopumilus sp.]|nr:hypothetical protein [Nitrosopumilus sp.]MDH3384680.1 hypothetical protein [Nitrosopumilus sp.]